MYKKEICFKVDVYYCKIYYMDIKNDLTWKVMYIVLSPGSTLISSYVFLAYVSSIIDTYNIRIYNF